MTNYDVRPKHVLGFSVKFLPILLLAAHSLSFGCNLSSWGLLYLLCSSATGCTTLPGSCFGDVAANWRLTIAMLLQIGTILGITFAIVASLLATIFCNCNITVGQFKKIFTLFAMVLLLPELASICLYGWHTAKLQLKGHPVLTTDPILIDQLAKNMGFVHIGTLAIMACQFIYTFLLALGQVVSLVNHR